MNLIICTRDLVFGVGSQVKNEIKKFDLNPNIEKIIVIGPKHLEGYSSKVSFEILENKGNFFVTKEPNFAFKCNKKIKKILKNEKINRIYTHCPYYSENFEVESIAKFHGLHYSILKNYPLTPKFLIASIFHRLYSYFDYRTIKYADKVYFVSKRTLEEAKEFYPKFKYKFFHQPNEVDKNKFFKLSKKEKLRIKKELGFDDGKKNILFVGRLEPLKGILLLIKVIKEINNPNLRLIVIGDGLLKNKIQKYPFVKYLGKIPNEELYKYYNTVDLFVLPSLYENMPMTILEAKACGCKVLASNVGDNRYYISKCDLFNINNKKEFEVMLKCRVLIKNY